MIVLRLVAFTLSIAISGCLGLAEAPAYPQNDPAFSAPQPVQMPGVDSDPAEPLRLQPGDVMRLQLQSVESETIDGLMIDELGNVFLPLAGDVQVGGLSLSEAKARIQTALRRFDRVVEVTVYLATPSGQQATVLGAITRPGRVQLSPGFRVADLVATAGGFLQTGADDEFVSLADVAGARLIRNQQVVPVDVGRAVAGDPRHNIRVRAGDHLYVPPVRGQRVSVLGEVNEPQVFIHRDGVRLTEALARAGGITINGDRADVRVIRGDLAAPTVYTTSMVDIVNGRSHDVALAPGDVVFVTEHWIASVGEVLERLSPLLSAGTSVGLAILIAD
ncbi:MAG: SLBB domain-containing protein [Myxococcota bacterium]